MNKLEISIVWVREESSQNTSSPAVTLTISKKQQMSQQQRLLQGNTRGHTQDMLNLSTFST